MRNNGRNMDAFIVLPHWRVEGGAGYYIRDLIKKLRTTGTVQVAGPYAADYAVSPIRSKYLDKLTIQSLATYEGICPAAALYNFVIAAFGAASLLVALLRGYPDGCADVVILTSSVQAPAIPIARRMFPKSQIVVLVQENVCLSRGLGRVTRSLLTRAHIIVSITETWAQHAQENGLKTVVIPNTYDSSYASPCQNTSTEVNSDLLYVGGDAKIKGFHNLLSAIPALLSVPGRRIICLGRYSKPARKMLERAHTGANPDTMLDVVGLVPDIRPYLKGTKLLILPIGSPHFCRPAIEAGLFGKTFLIPNFVELSDFVRDGENCLTFLPADSADLVAKANQLLHDQVLMAKLGDGNKDLARNFAETPFHVDALIQSIRMSRVRGNQTKVGAR